MNVDLRPALALAVGTAVGLALVALASGELPDRGFLVGIALVPLVHVAFEKLDGPLERRTARIGAVVVGGGLVGAALLLL